MIRNDEREDEDMGTQGMVLIEDYEWDARAAEVAELNELRRRARRLAATGGLDVEHRTLARAGRIVLGLEREVGA